MPTPRDPTEPLTRVSIDLSEEETSFVDRFAAYKNAMAVVQKETLRVKWKRKSMAENLTTNQIDAETKTMEAQFKAVGPLPMDTSDSAMQEYVKRVLAWQKKRAK